MAQRQKGGLLKMCPIERKNLSALYKYNLFTSLALTIVASMVFTDQLLLRLDFDLGRFAYVKSAMFIAPALFYQLLSPYLQAFGRDKLVCLWSYLLRITVPTALPFIALFFTDKNVLFWSAVVIFGFSHTMAAFANNSLMVLYRKVLPGENFNHYSAIIAFLFNGPIYISSLAVAYVIDRFAHLDNRDFYLLLGGLQIIMVLFEIPAIYFLRQLQLPANGKHPRASFSSMFLPLKDRAYAKVLILTILRGIWTGLLVSYMTVYFLKVANYSNLKIVIITMCTAVGGMALSTVLGKFIDHNGYRRWLIGISGVMAVASGFFAVFWGNWWWQWLFIIMVWDGSSSVGGMLLFFLENTAATKLAKGNSVNLYVGLYSFIRNVATFSGCILGGLWFRQLEVWIHVDQNHEISEVFRYYFGSCGGLMVILLILLMYFWHDRLHRKREDRSIA